MQWTANRKGFREFLGRGVSLICISLHDLENHGAEWRKND